MHHIQKAGAREKMWPNLSGKGEVPECSWSDIHDRSWSYTIKPQDPSPLAIRLSLGRTWSLSLLAATLIPRSTSPHRISESTSPPTLDDPRPKLHDKERPRRCMLWCPRKWSKAPADADRAERRITRCSAGTGEPRGARSFWLWMKGLPS